MTQSIVITGELYSSKNSRMIVGQGRKFLIKSKNAKKQEYDFAFQLAQHKVKWFAMKMQGAPFARSPYPFRVSFKIYRETKRRFDYTNIIQGLLDAMVKADYLPDDSAEYIIPVFEQYEVDKDNPRTVIRIVQ